AHGRGAKRRSWCAVGKVCGRRGPLRRRSGYCQQSTLARENRRNSGFSSALRLRLFDCRRPRGEDPQDVYRRGGRSVAARSKRKQRFRLRSTVLFSGTQQDICGNLPGREAEGQPSRESFWAISGLESTRQRAAPKLIKAL